MKTLKDYILGTKRQLSNDNYILTEKLKLNKKSKAVEYNYHPKDKDELRSIIEQLLKERGKDADLNDIDVSSIQDFCYISPARDYGLFFKLDIGNIDISEWNMSNATNISYMFYDCKKFNSNLSHWDVSNVRDINFMFYGCKDFNCDLSKWDVSNVKRMEYMFCECKKFNCDISNWDISNVEKMDAMFYGCSNFNYDLSKWDVSKVTNIKHIFFGCTSLTNKPSWYEE